jgi:hypothetical protein
MAVTLEELATRMDRIEREMGKLRAAGDVIQEGPLKGLRIMSRAERAALSHTWKSIVESMGGKDVRPIGAEALQERLRAEGFGDDNVFSRTIREMREE